MVHVKLAPKATPVAALERGMTTEQPMEFGDLFSFDKKVTPTIIKPIYFIGSGVIVLANFFYFFFGFFRLFTGAFFGGLWDMVAAILTVIFGVLALRIGTEICLTLFELHDRTLGSSSSQV